MDKQQGLRNLVQNGSIISGNDIYQYDHHLDLISELEKFLSCNIKHGKKEIWYKEIITKENLSNIVTSITFKFDFDQLLHEIKISYYYESYVKMLTLDKTIVEGKEVTPERFFNYNY